MSLRSSTKGRCKRSERCPRRHQRGERRLGGSRPVCGTRDGTRAHVAHCVFHGGGNFDESRNVRRDFNATQIARPEVQNAIQRHEDHSGVRWLCEIASVSLVARIPCPEGECAAAEEIHEQVGRGRESDARAQGPVKQLNRRVAVATGSAVSRVPAPGRHCECRPPRDPEINRPGYRARCGRQGR
jgi:hypothetical protein